MGTQGIHRTVFKRVLTEQVIDGVIVHRGIDVLPFSILVILATETPNKDANSTLLYSKINLEEMNLSALMILNIHKSLMDIKRA